MSSGTKYSPYFLYRGTNQLDSVPNATVLGRWLMVLVNGSGQLPIGPHISVTASYSDDLIQAT